VRGGTHEQTGLERQPSWYLVAERDRMIAPETQRFMAHRAGSHILAMELDHTPLAAAPDQVLAIITEAVDAVTQEDAFDPHRIGRRA